jgi:tetratricopeptide (TPR) repeat protein
MNGPPSHEGIPWSPSLIRKLDELCVRFEEAWKAGSSTRPRLEEYLAEVPDCARGPAVEELLALELAYRCRSGERPTVEEYERRLPGHLATIRVVFEKMADAPAAGQAGGRPGSDPEPPAPLSGSGSPGGALPPTTPEGVLTTDESAPPPEAPVNGMGAGPEDGRPVVPGYEIQGELGRGGMGVVYKARHLPLKRVVALKMILAGAHAEAELLSRFRREAEAVARLQHPHIVQIYEIGEHGGLPFFSLEFVEGGSLDRRIRGGPQPAVPAAELIETLARAVQAAHERGIVHRDLKPANVLLTPDGTPKVTDFGLAKQLDGQTAHTETGVVLGTFKYMAPEQAWGRAREVGPLADVYALGVILYELLTGRVPFLGENAFHTLEQVRTHDPVPPRRLQPAVPRDLEKICLKCLEKEPRKRYASALDLADDLRRFLKGEPVRARLITPAGRALRWAARHRAAAVASVALVFAAAGGLGTLVTYSLLTAQQKSQKLAALQERVDRRDAIARLASQGREAKVAGQLEEAIEKLGLALDKWGPELGDETGECLGIQREFDEAKRLLANRKLTREWKDHLDRSRPLFSEVSFREISFTESAQDADRAAIRRAAPDALAEFGLSNADTPAVAASHLQTYREAAESSRQLDAIAADCYQALLSWAEAESPPGSGDKAGALRALRLLDLAAALGQIHQLPTPGAFHFRHARYLALVGKEAEARAERERAAGVKPDTALDLFLTALESHRQGQWDQTAATCEQVLRLQPDHFWAQYLKALGHVKTKHWGEARAELDACLVRQPDFTWGRQLRAVVETQLGESERAEEDFAQVLRRVEEPAARSVVLTNRGVLWVRRERWHEAVDDFREAVRLRPGVPETYINLAQARRRLKDWKAALATLDEALARCPQDAAGLYHTRAEFDLEREDPAAARRDFEQAIVHQPAGSSSERLASDYVQLAHLQRLAGKPEAALANCDAALRLRPDYPPAHRYRAEALLALGRYEDAGKALDRYLHGEKPTATVYRVRGLIHAGLRRYAEAVDAYGRSLALRQDAGTLAYRGWAYLELDAPRPALADFEAALRLDPAQTDALCGRGSARVRLGRLADGVADAEEYLRRERPAAQHFFEAACIYARSVGELERRMGGRWTTGDPATRYQERAVELLRAALDETPAGERQRFWRTNIASAADLVPIRRSTGFLELARGYPR